MARMIRAFRPVSISRGAPERPEDDPERALTAPRDAAEGLLAPRRAGGGGDRLAAIEDELRPLGDETAGDQGAPETADDLEDRGERQVPDQAGEPGIRLQADLPADQDEPDPSDHLRDFEACRGQEQNVVREGLARRLVLAQDHQADGGSGRLAQLAEERGVAEPGHCLRGHDHARSEARGEAPALLGVAGRHHLVAELGQTASETATASGGRFDDQHCRTAHRRAPGIERFRWDRPGAARATIPAGSFVKQPRTAVRSSRNWLPEPVSQFRHLGKL